MPVIGVAAEGPGLRRRLRPAHGGDGLRLSPARRPPAVPPRQLRRAAALRGARTRTWTPWSCLRLALASVVEMSWLLVATAAAAVAVALRRAAAWTCTRSWSRPPCCGSSPRRSGVVLPGKFYAHYFMLWLPPLCIAAALGLREAVARLAPRRPGVALLAVVAIIASMPVLGDLAQLGRRGVGAAAARPAARSGGHHRPHGAAGRDRLRRELRAGHLLPRRLAAAHAHAALAATRGPLRRVHRPGERRGAGARAGEPALPDGHLPAAVAARCGRAPNRRSRPRWTRATSWRGPCRGPRGLVELWRRR